MDFICVMFRSPESVFGKFLETRCLKFKLTLGVPINKLLVTKF